LNIKENNAFLYLPYNSNFRINYLVNEFLFQFKIRIFMEEKEMRFALLDGRWNQGTDGLGGVEWRMEWRRV